MILAPPSKKKLAISIELPTPTTVCEVDEHNRAVRKWVHKLERHVLAPLHQAHRLESVALSLS